MPESNRHPAKMLPEIARRVIAAYSEPGDLVLDPMCGIATTLDRGDPPGAPRDRCRAGGPLGIARREEHRVRPQSRRDREGSDSARTTLGYLGRGVLDELAGQVPLILTSPPYGNATLGDPRGGKGMARSRASEGRRMTAADRARAAKAPNWCRYGDSAGSVARLRYGTTDEALNGSRARGELSRGDGRDLHGLRKDAQPRRIPRARHEEPSRGRGAAKHRRATRSLSASRPAWCSSSTSSRCSQPSVTASCCRAPPISS